MPCGNPCRLYIHLAITYSIGPSSVVWSELGPARLFCQWECLNCTGHGLSVSCVLSVALISGLRCGLTVSTLHTQTWIHICICVLPTKQKLQNANLWDMRVLSYGSGLVCRACWQMPCFPSAAMNWALAIYSSTELIAHFLWPHRWHKGHDKDSTNLESCHTCRKHGKKEPQAFVHCGSFGHPDLHSLNDYKFVILVYQLKF